MFHASENHARNENRAAYNERNYRGRSEIKIRNALRPRAVLGGNHENGEKNHRERGANVLKSDEERSSRKGEEN